MTDNHIFRDRAWLSADELDSVRAELAEHVHETDDERSYSASFVLAEEGVGHFCCSEHFADLGSLRKVRDAASVVSGMLAALVEAIDRLVAEKSDG